MVLTTYVWQHWRKKQPLLYSPCVLQHTKASGQGDSQNHGRAGKNCLKWGVKTNKELFPCFSLKKKGIFFKMQEDKLERFASDVNSSKYLQLTKKIHQNLWWMIRLLGPVLITHTSEVEPMPFMNNLIKMMTSLIFVAYKTVNIDLIRLRVMKCNLNY